ncbi:MAG: hypothetical protein U0166_27035 [Acidobacteriota bacterium]
MVLPPSLQKELHPIAEEVAEFRETSPADKLRILHELCEDAIRQVMMHPDPERILDWQAPLPASTVAALSRLRTGHGG